MKFWRIPSGSRIEPFGDAPDDAQVGVETLKAAVERTAAACGLEVCPGLPGTGEREFLLAPDYFFFTGEAVAEFIALAPREPGIFRLWLKAGPLVEYLKPLSAGEEKADGLGLDCFLVRGTTIPASGCWPELKGQLAARASAVYLEPGEQCEELTLSRPGPPRRKLPVPQTTRVAAHLLHWVQLLWLNQLLCRTRLLEHWSQDSKIRRRLGEARPLCPGELRRLNVIGPGCDIHPTAYVEGSILGRGVRLGPRAFVCNSIVGDGVEVADFSRFHRCVVGAGCHTLNDSHFSWSTFYPESTLASFLLRNSVIGRRVFLTSGVMFWDEPINGTVPVKAGGAEVDTGRWMLGGCAGHRCLLGTRAIFLPGRAVPNDTIIVMRPEEGVTKIPEAAAAGHPYVYDGGEIRELSAALPGWRAAELE
jgi:acetyltransferase-like isoleucine patch superfamily enzyme